MNFNCLSDLFSFNCQRKKKRSKDRRKDGSNSDSEDVSTLNQAVNSNFSGQEEENSDIIDTYSKSDVSSKVKIKKTIQLGKKETPYTKNNKKEMSSNSSVSTINNEDKHLNTRYTPSKGKGVRTNQKVKITKEGNLDDKSSISNNLNESLHKLNIKKKNLNLEKISNSVKEIHRKKKSEAKPFQQPQSSKDSFENTEYSPSTLTVSNDSEKRNILTENDLTKINNRKKLALDSDSEIWFLKNKTENEKFNHSLRKKILEHLEKNKLR